MLDVAHRLDAAGQHDVRRAGLHHHGRRDHCLQAAAAAAVDLQTGHADRKPGVQRGPSADARRLGVGVGLGEHDVFDGFGVDAAALYDRLDDSRGQILGTQRPKCATECTHGGPHRRDDRRSPHASPRQRPADGSRRLVRWSCRSQMIVSSSNASRYRTRPVRRSSSRSRGAFPSVSKVDRYLGELAADSGSDARHVHL